MHEQLMQKIEALNDVELIILVSLTIGQHCMFSTNTSDIFDLQDTLVSILRATFGLGPASLRCNKDTTVDELNDSLLHSRPAGNAGYNGWSTISFEPMRPSASRTTTDDSFTEHKSIASTFIVADLDMAPECVQVQLIELLRTRRIFTRNSMHTAPKDFLLIVTLSRPDSRLSYHLNDKIASSHLSVVDDQPTRSQTAPALISQAEVEQLRLQASKVRLTAEVDAYLYNMVLCMRMSRYVQGGVSATATRQMRALCKALSALHGIDFVTPSLVMLAARQVYPHRLILATATTEQSLQWGSDPVAVQRLLESSTIAEVIDDVIASVETPL